MDRAAGAGYSNAHLRRMLGYYVEWHLCEAGHRFYFMNAMAPPRSRTEPHAVAAADISPGALDIAKRTPCSSD